MAEGFGRGIAIASILAAIAAVGMYTYLLSECFLFSGRSCDALGIRTLYAAGGATLLALATVLALLTREAVIGRVLLIVTTLAGIVGAGLFAAMTIDAPWPALRAAGMGLVGAAALTVLCAAVAWRRTA